MPRSHIGGVKTGAILTGSMIWLLAAGAGQAQPAGLSFRPVAVLPAEATFFTTDKLQQVYIVDAANDVIKYAPTGQELFRYNNNTLGALTRVDATNPFNLLLFYPEHQTAITLDRTLNKIDEFTLWEYNALDTRALAMAVDNGIWLYDGAVHRLRLIGRDGRTLRESDNLSLLLPAPPAPAGLAAGDNLIVANDPALGLFLFDNFGQFIRALPLPGVTDFQLLDQQLLCRREDGVVLADLTGLRELPFPLPEGAARPRQARLQKDRLYLLQDDGRVHIYEVTQKK